MASNAFTKPAVEPGIRRSVVPFCILFDNRGKLYRELAHGDVEDGIRYIRSNTLWYDFGSFPPPPIRYIRSNTLCKQVLIAQSAELSKILLADNFLCLMLLDPLKRRNYLLLPHIAMLILIKSVFNPILKELHFQ